MTHTKEHASQKERGTWLSIWLILIMIHGVIAAGLIWYLRTEGGLGSPWWVFALLFVLAIADIVAAIAAWNWKKWGLQLYALSTVVGIVIGLVLTASQLIVFHDIIPLAILGYLIKDKRSYFS
jgi:hypothetical protein